MKENEVDRIVSNPAAARRVCFTVNGNSHRFNIGNGMGEISPSDTLVKTLRENLGLTGAKISCDDGSCGCCTVIMDGKSVLSCRILTVECEGKEITTIEGLGDKKSGKPDPLQQAFIDHQAFQCGFCTPGIIMTAKAFLNENPHPSKEEVQEALSGNFCRCISHYQVVEAVITAAEKGSDHGR